MLVSITRKFYMIKKHWKDDTSKTIVDIQYQRDRNLLSNGVFLQLKSWRRTK
jgi:hypothetical protein